MPPPYVFSVCKDVGAMGRSPRAYFLSTTRVHQQCIAINAAGLAYTFDFAQVYDDGQRMIYCGDEGAKV